MGYDGDAYRLRREELLPAAPADGREAEPIVLEVDLRSPRAAPRGVLVELLQLRSNRTQLEVKT